MMSWSSAPFVSMVVLRHSSSASRSDDTLHDSSCRKRWKTPFFKHSCLAHKPRPPTGQPADLQSCEGVVQRVQEVLELFILVGQRADDPAKSFLLNNQSALSVNSDVQTHWHHSASIVTQPSPSSSSSSLSSSTTTLSALPSSSSSSYHHHLNMNEDVIMMMTMMTMVMTLSIRGLLIPRSERRVCETERGSAEWGSEKKRERPRDLLLINRVRLNW